MNKMFKTVLLIILAAAPAARATTSNWSFSGNKFSGSGTITYDSTISTDSLDGFEGYLITGLTGVIDGQAITGFTPAASGGSDNLLGDGSSGNNTVTASTASPVYFDTGIDTHGSTGKADGIHMTTATYSVLGYSFDSIPASDNYEVILVNNSSAFVKLDSGSFSVTPVPEPSVLALGALGGAGALLLKHRRRK